MPALWQKEQRTKIRSKNAFLKSVFNTVFTTAAIKIMSEKIKTLFDAPDTADQ